MNAKAEREISLNLQTNFHRWILKFLKQTKQNEKRIEMRRDGNFNSLLSLPPSDHSTWETYPFQNVYKLN